MTTATEEQVIKEEQGWKVVLVHEHQRALPGEGGSDYKPVSVREHLRQVWSDGREQRMKVGFKWKAGEMCSELLEAMAEVQGMRPNLPKDHLWTLDQAICVLHHGLELKEQKHFVHKNGKRRLKSVSVLCVA